MFQLWRWMFACTVVVALMGSTCFFLRLPNLVLATVGGHILFIGPLMLLIIHKLDVIGETKGLGDLLGLEGELVVIAGLSQSETDESDFTEYYIMENTLFGGEKLTKIANINEFYPSSVLLSGLRVRARGSLIGSILGSIQILRASSLAIDIDIPDWSGGGASTKRAETQVVNPNMGRLRKPAVIFITFPDARPNVTVAEFESFYSSSTENYRNAVRKQTGGHLTFAQPGAGYAKFEVKITTPAKGCNQTAWRDQGLAAAVKLGLNISQFNHIIFVVNAYEKGCPWCGIARVGCRDSNPATRCYSLMGCRFPKIIGHELGHNLGMQHSGTPGQEYGDTTCVMGSNSGNALINLPQRVRNGWLPLSKLVTTVSGLKTYNISDAYNPATSLPVGLRVPNRSGAPIWDAFWVSWRFQSFDDPTMRGANNNAVHVYIMPAHTIFPTLVATLSVGMSFTNATIGAEIKFVSSNLQSRSALVTVKSP